MTARIRAFPTPRRWLVATAIVVFATALWAATRSEAATAGVDIRDFSFQPAELTVGSGDTVTWTNHDSEPHAVQGGSVNSPDIGPGGTFSHTFTETGDFSYLCRIHTYMTGVVHVVADTPPSTTTTAPPSTTTTAPPSTTTTVGDGSTTTTTGAPGSTTTTTTGDPGSSTTTTTAPPPPSSGGPAFQDVPDDPSATYPPGTPGAETPPPKTAPPATTTTTTQPSAPPPSQDVPDDPHDSTTPGAHAGDGETPDDGGGDGGGGDPGDPGGPGGPGPVDLGDGNVLAPYSVEGGVKVFHLDMAPTTVETAPGVTKPAYAFNGTVPGPVLRVNEGDRVRFVVDNHLPFATAVHWHGMILPNDQDGVPGITQPAIEPGGRYVYEWTAIATGTHWYHSHSSGRHIGKGLYGSLEVVPKLGDFTADRDYRLLLGDTDLGFVLNGRMFPSTTPLVAKVGETVRLRVINTGDQVHAMHLHGTTFDVVAQDGNRMQVPVTMDTLTISPGQTFDLLAKESNPGTWLLHCHIFAHSHLSMDEHEPGHTGMTGMVTSLEVAPAGANVPDSPLDTLPIASASLAGQTDGPFGPVGPLDIASLIAVLALAVTVLLTGRHVRAVPLFRLIQNRKETR